MNTDEILDHAIEMRDIANSSDPSAFDWRAPLRTFVQSGVFTTPQAARILRISVQYAQRYLKSIEGPARTDKRTRGGVSGLLDPASLDQIKLLRAMWSVREGDDAAERKRARPISDVERSLIEELVAEEGNGVRVISHLTTVPVQTLYRVKKEAEEA